MVFGTGGSVKFIVVSLILRDALIEGFHCIVVFGQVPVIMLAAVYSISYLVYMWLVG